MQITFSIPVYLPARGYGGPVIWLADLAGALAERGHRVRVVTSDLGPTRSERLEVRREILDGVEVLRLPATLRYRWTPLCLSALWRAGALLEGTRILHVMGHRDGISPPLVWAARRRAIPWVVEPHGTVRRAGRSALKKAVYDTLVGDGILRGAARILVASSVEEEECRRAGLAEERLLRMPNGLRLPQIPAPEERRGLRRRLGIRDDETFLLTLGRVNYRKGLDFVADRLRSLAEGGRDRFRWALVGPDEEDGTAERVRRALGPFRDRLLEPGPVYGADRWTWLAAADLFPLASPFAENFGIAPAEAMAVGTPVLVSDACGVGDWVTPESGRVLPLDPRRWEEALAGVMEGRLRFERARVRAAVEPLAVERVVGQQEKVYREVLGEEEGESPPNLSRRNAARI